MSEIERQRDAALIGYNECRATIEDVRRALGATAHEGPLLAAMRVTEQRDRMQHEREFFQSAFIEQGDVLCKVIEQRDKALCELEMWQDGNIMHESHRNEIQGLEQQRDRLAEAFRLTLMENLDLCDGDICTLKRLKDTIGFDLANYDSIFRKPSTEDRIKLLKLLGFEQTNKQP